MDPPIINEASFSAANPAAYSLTEIWPFSEAGSGGVLGGGLGLRMGSFGSGGPSGFGDSSVPVTRDVSVDQSTVTEQSGSRGVGGGGQKRKGVFNCEDESSKLVSTSSANDLNDFDGKRMKASEYQVGNDGPKAEAESSSKTDNQPTERSSKPDPPKDYIHVRARRGQATDSHSLAERARREKISERMKLLQDLVPGCNKVIGKALVLDEIINYIQSLQRQVEFLSMKLEAVNSRMTPRTDSFPPKELSAPPFGATGSISGSQIPTEYAQGAQPEWLHMQLGAPTFDATGAMIGSQTPREYTQGPQPEWLHMQLGSGFERAT